MLIIFLYVVILKLLRHPKAENELHKSIGCYQRNVSFVDYTAIQYVSLSSNPSYIIS